MFDKVITIQAIIWFKDLRDKKSAVKFKSNPRLFSRAF